MLRKPRSYAEIYNDLDDDIVNVFRMARDRGEELRRALELTPFSRVEFVQSYEPVADSLELARRTIVRSFQGFGSASVCGNVSGFRANSNRSGTTPAHDWKNYPDALVALIERLQGVVIEHRDAIKVMQAHDSLDAVHYADPPYVHSTRSEKVRGTVNRKSYKHEMTDDQHCELAEVLHNLRGAVVLSGYPSDLYNRLYADWRRTERQANADGASPRVEVLWLSPGCVAGQGRLFG